MSLFEGEDAILRALAEAAIPPGQILPGAGSTTVARLKDALEAMPAAVSWAYRGMLWTLETQTAARTGTRFSALPLGGRLKAMERLEQAEATRLLLRGLLLPLKLAHFDDPSVYAALGCRFAVDLPPLERPRWQEQISSAGELGDRAELECEVVV
ncbi:MAG TPA: hypothetical protein VH208_11430, partial [Myxococcaceae bacterium]|nr:hypothetical protein [Myxococcaceae bacterium]